MSETGLRRIYNSNFLEYASYVIKDRAIPDAADGLKPVQRRILWTLQEMDDGRFSKVANVIGHCMRFHPHGDRSIGDALVSLANRGFFIERQGNFGNIFTGDEASAARYIECRLTDLARKTLFNKRITEFIPSYDGRNKEPVMLPSKLPVILLLGVEGIAVGMSTRILPHNFQEVLHAQIACLKDQEFILYPDFPTGGRIDISDYDEGRGKLRNRAKIETKGKHLIVRDLPYGSTTESLISSIEAAANKGKIKISSIDDYTTDKVEINIHLARGIGPDEGLKQLFAHTECEKSHSSNIVVIQEGIPVESTVTELIHYSTGRLIEILKLELKLELQDYLDRLHWLDLEQIFMENRLYKQIEECDSWEDVRRTVKESLVPFVQEKGIEVSEEDIDKLLSLKIRRISRFDIESHRSEMKELKKKCRTVRSFLRNIVGHTVSYLEGLLEEYGSSFPRLTSIEDFSDINVKEVAIRNLKAGFNPDTGLLGTSIKGPRSFTVSEYDRFVFLLSDGTYKVIPVTDKYFIDGNVEYCGVLDREKIFTAVYKQAGTGIAYIKRFSVDSFILDKEYRYVPDGGELIYFTNEPEMKLDFWFQRQKRMRKRKESCLISEYKVTSYSAKGVQLCGRRSISSIKGTLVDDEVEEEPVEDQAPEEETPVLEEPAEELPPPEPPTQEELDRKTEEFQKKVSDVLEKAEGDLFSDID